MLSATSSVMQYQQQKSAAKAQTKAVQANVAEQMAAVQLQQHQANSQAADQISERARRARAEAARLRVIAGEHGGTGASAERLEEATLADAATDISTIQQNARNAAFQSHQEARSLRARGQSQLNSIDRPSGAALGLQLGQAALSAYTGFKQGQLASKAGGNI